MFSTIIECNLLLGDGKLLLNIPVLMEIIIIKAESFSSASTQWQIFLHWSNNHSSGALIFN